MDRNLKFVKKLTPKEQARIIAVIEKILTGNTVDLDSKKLVGYQDVYRVRSGTVRIIFISNRYENTILEIARRDDSTYRDY